MIDRLLPSFQLVASRWARLCADRPAAVLIVALGFAALGLLAAVTRLELEPDATALIPPDTPFLQDYERYKTIFPYDRRTNIVVIDAPGADQAAFAQESLQKALAQHGALFNAVRSPDSSAFMRRNGLLYLERAQLEDLADRLLTAQPAIATLARDPSLRGIAELYALARENQPETAERLADFLAETAGRTLDGAPHAASWSSLLMGEEVAPARRLLLVQGRLDGVEQEVGGDTSEVIREEVRALGLTEEAGYRVRLTGRGPLSAEEVDGMVADIERAGLLSLLLVALVLWLGFRSVRMIVIGVATLLIGLAWTAGYAAFAVDNLNLLSAVFSVLFIGLGIDFAIHFALRFREEAADAPGTERGIARAGGASVGTLGLCALTSAVGFLAFLPTDFRGLGELGLISAGGLIFAFLASFTVMPALLALLRTYRLPKEKGTRLPGGAGLARWIARRGTVIRWTALAAGLAAAVVASQISFDFNTLSLKDPNAESIRTLKDLQQDGTLTPYSLSIVTENAAAADAAAERLRALPEVADARGPMTLLPEGQQAKLDILRDLAASLWPALTPSNLKDPLDAAGRKAALQRLEELARAAAAAAADDDDAEAGEAAARLADRLARLGAAPAERLAAFEDRLTRHVPMLLQRLKQSLQAERVTLESVPADLRARYISEDGRGRAVALPAEDLTDFRALRRFTEAVTALYPDATGRPVLEAGVGDIVTDAFLQAVASAAVVVFLLVWMVLRDGRAALSVMAPLILSAVLIGAYSVIFGRPFNSTNVIVIPLILGLGVDNGVHFTMRWRAERSLDRLMRSSTPRATLLSGATTIASFATLMLSDNRGVAGMGEFLTVGVSAVLLTTCVVLPALLMRLDHYRAEKP